MMSTKQLYAIFVPAIGLVAIALIIRIVQYEPLFAKKTEAEALQVEDMVPIFPEDPILGNKKAPMTLIAFEDFACNGCKEQNMIFEELLAKHPKKVKIVWKGLPVVTFPIPSERAHEYAFCANEQNKFNEFKQYAFTNSDQLTEEILNDIAKQIDLNERKLANCLESERPKKHIELTEQLGLLLHIQAVPTTFFNNKQIESPTTISGWEFLLGLDTE